jgi:hypothetical protein
MSISIGDKEEVTESSILPITTFDQVDSSILTAPIAEDGTGACLVSAPLPVTVRPALRSDFNLRPIDPRLSLCSTRCPPCLAGGELRDIDRDIHDLVKRL